MSDKVNHDTAKRVTDAAKNAVHRLNIFSEGGKRTGQRTAWATAMLAKLRRAIGTSPGENADILELTADPEGDAHAEWALHTALTLFALHQQGSDDSVHKAGQRFGRAVASVISPDKSNEKGVRRRFNALITADSLDELVYHARGLVQLMKQAQPRVTLDYARFAEALYWYQSDGHRTGVRMEWGRDFFIATNQNEKEKEK